MQKHQCFKEILDLEELWLNDQVNIIPIPQNQKYPMDQGWNHKEYNKDDIIYKGINENRGIIINNNICCIDIDGNQPADKDASIKRESRQFLGEVLQRVFPDGLWVKTANDGYHCYLKVNDDIEFLNNYKEHVLSKKFQYPEDCPIKDLRQIPLESGVEIWAKQNNTRQVVLPGSMVNGKTYSILDVGVQKFSDLKPLSILQIEKRIEDEFIKSGFRYYYESLQVTAPTTVNTQVKDYNVNTEQIIKHDIPWYFMDQLADFLIEIFEFNYNNGKHQLALYLGGYLAKYVSIESIERLGHLIVSKVRSGFFKNNAAFIHTLTKSEDRARYIDTAGGNVLYNEYIQPMGIPSDVFFGKMVLYMGTGFYFYPGGTSFTASYDKIKYDTYNYRTLVQICHKNKEGIEVPTRQTGDLNIIITEIIKEYNPLVLEDDPLFIIKYVSESGINSVSDTTLTDLANKISNIPGIYGGQRIKSILSHIIKRYQQIGLVKEIFKPPVPGICLIEGNMERYNHKLEKMDIKKVDPAPALELLEEIRKIIPWTKHKFGHIIRIGLTLPFRHLFEQFGIQSNYLILCGTGGTYKSTSAELILNFYEDTFNTPPYMNVFGAGTIKSPYQLGEKYGTSLNGIVINEIGTLASDPELLEIFKAGIETRVARKTQLATHYSYQTFIMTANVELPESEAVLRRSDIFYMTTSDRITPKIEKELKDLLNKGGGMNERFKELRPIGDFCTYIISQNLDKIKDMEIEDIRFMLIDELQKTTDINLSYLKYSDYNQEREIERHADQFIIDGLIGYITQRYNSNNIPNYSNMLRNSSKRNKEFTMEKFSILLDKRMLGVIEQCDYRKKGSKEYKTYVLFRIKALKTIYKEQTSSIVRPKAFWEEISKYTHYDNIPFKYHYVKNYPVQRVEGILVDPEFIVDLLNNDIKFDDEEIEDE